MYWEVQFHLAHRLCKMCKLMQPNLRANVSFMMQMLTPEQGLELMEQVPRSLVLCAGQATGDTNRGVAVMEVSRHIFVGN